MKNRITQTVKKYNLISNGDKILIALSGGADSVFLCEYLLSVKDEFGLTLEAAHIEHGIRGEESIADMEFCKAYCKKNSIPLHIFRINAVEEAKKAGLSVEEYSRNKRYDFFSSIACDKIATAHNATDNAETLIYRLARGTSLKGLCSIPPRRDKIIRPLIEISADEIRRELDNQGISYCVDSTNASSEYTRNFIRNEIVPRMNKINSDFVSAASRLTETLNIDNDYLESIAEEEYSKANTDGQLSVDYLKSLPDAILGRVVAILLMKNSLPCDYYRINHIKLLLDAPSRFQITGNYYAISNKNALRIAELSDCNSVINAEFFILSIDDYKVSGKFDFACDYDKVCGSACARTRREGDRITPPGRGCTKTLKKLFNELSVPVENRNSIPVITDDNGVIGICGYCVDERVKLDENTKNVLTVSIHTEDKN